MARGGKRPGAGRPKGTPNKATAEAKRVALAFLNRRSDEELDTLWNAAKGESASKALSTWLGALEFVMPKLGRTEVTGEGGGPVRVIKVDQDDG